MRLLIIPNPDWAISFKEGVINHVYLEAETQVAMFSKKLSHIIVTVAIYKSGGDC